MERKKPRAAVAAAGSLLIALAIGCDSGSGRDPIVVDGPTFASDLIDVYETQGAEAARDFVLDSIQNGDTMLYPSFQYTITDIDLTHTTLGNLIGDGAHPGSPPAAFNTVTCIDMSSGDVLELWLTATDYTPL